MSMRELLQEYCDIVAPIGHEGPMRDRLLADWEETTTDMKVSRVGNVLAHVNDRPGAPRVLIAGHMDEISMMVKSIDDAGFLHLTHAFSAGVKAGAQLGEALNRDLLVKGNSDWFPGVLARVTGHLRSGLADPGAAPGWDDVALDVGLSREEVLAAGIHPGSPVVFAPCSRDIGRYFATKAIDDRAPLAIMTALAERLAGDPVDYDLYFLATVMEENGLQGAASTFTFNLEFDFAINLEIGMAGDIPAMSELDMPVRLGGGPVIIHKDSRIHYSVDITDHLRQVAQQAEIPFQDAVFYGFGSDGSIFIRQDIPTALVAPPARYTHSAQEMVDVGDVEACVDLLEAVLRSDGPA